MQAGFNQDVRCRGRVYHVQTEDAGVELARVTTHLFLGGAVIAKRTASYAEFRDAPDLAARVRSLMEEQHRELLRSLVAGKLDGETAGGRDSAAPERTAGRSPGRVESPEPIR